MRPRYLLILATNAASGFCTQQVAEQAGLALVHQRDPVTAFANKACPSLSLADGGIILGTLFSRGDMTRPIGSLSAAGMAQLTSSEDGLLRHFWGGYVSTTVQDGTVSVMREPSGALPCYWIRTPDAVILASDVDLLLRSGGFRPAVNWDALGRFLYWDGLPVPETALRGVHDLLPGFGLKLAQGQTGISARWNPWAFAGRTEDRDVARTAQQLHHTVANCIAAWGSIFAAPLISVSGGLDSSILAACLSEAGIDAQCLTMFTDDPAGDERYYARLLCRHLGFDLFERRFDIGTVDVQRALGGHLPRPIGRTHEQAHEQAHLHFAQEQGVDAFFSGNGGDNVFAYSQSAIAIVDRALHAGLTRDLVSTVRDICVQSQTGALTVLRAAIRIARAPRSYRWRPNAMLLDPGLRASLDEHCIGHPWLVAPPGALPGKAAHIAALLRTQMNLEPGRSRYAPVVNPLLSQPIVELCLAIPSWEWRSGGRDRAMARDAFAVSLPHDIVARRSKGTPDPFCSVVMRRHRSSIRERLLDGRLAQQGLLDRSAIEQALDSRQMTSGEINARVLQLLNVEAWLADWSERAGTFTDPSQATGHGVTHPND